MVTEGTLARARAGDEQAFRELTDPYRAELLALLPDPRLGGRRRGHAAGDPAGGLARPERLRGPVLAAVLAAPHRRQRLPERAARPQPPPTGGTADARAPPAHPYGRPGLGRPLPRRAARRPARRRARAGGALRRQGGRRAGVRHRLAAPAAAPARRPGAPRRARLPGG